MKNLTTLLLLGIALCYACSKHSSGDDEPVETDVSGTYKVHEITHNSVIMQDSALNRYYAYTNIDTVYNTGVSYTDKAQNRIRFSGTEFQLDSSNSWKRGGSSPGGWSHDSIYIDGHTLYYISGARSGGNNYSTVITGSIVK